MGTLPSFAGDLITVTADGQAVLGEDTTPARARTLALNNARRSAIERAVGVTVHGSSVVYNAQLVSDIISAFSRGLIVREEMLADGIKTEGGSAFYFVRLRAGIKPLEPRKLNDFRIVRADVLRGGGTTPSPNPVFRSGDEIQIQVKTSDDLYLNIFSVSQDGSITKLLPNSYVKNNKTSALTSFLFPNNVQRDMGVRLRVHAPKNRLTALETILVIGTKQQIDVPLPDGEKEATVTDVMQVLSEIDQSLWTDAVVGYEVRL